VNESVERGLRAISILVDSVSPSKPDNIPWEVRDVTRIPFDQVCMREVPSLFDGEDIKG
jgi:hypothetical protein